MNKYHSLLLATVDGFSFCATCIILMLSFTIYQVRFSQAEIRNNNPTPGVRRSSRRRFEPLEFWKSERLQYVKDDGMKQRECDFTTMLRTSGTLLHIICPYIHSFLPLCVCVFRVID